MNYSVNSLGFIILKASPKTLSLYNAVKCFLLSRKNARLKYCAQNPRKINFPGDSVVFIVMANALILDGDNAGYFR